MTGHLLDAYAWIDHMRKGPNSQVTARLRAAPSGSVFMCAVVLGELLFGAVRSGPAHEPANRALIAKLRRRYRVLRYDPAAAEEYAVIRAHLAALGTPIGANDLLIAAIARANGLILVTHNTAEFSRVPGLSLDDWQ